MSRRTLAVILVLLSSAGCLGGGGAKDRPTMDASLGDDFFDPLGNITQGAEVHFRNEGTREHTVTIHLEWVPADELELDEYVSPGESVSFVFEEEAVYHVWCRLHGTMGRGMHTNVTVEE